MLPAAPGKDHVEAGISLQLAERTMVEQTATPQSVEEPTLGQVDMP